MIHIAGTNGKGSTAAMIASILRETGRKVGLYTSPHLVRFNERIRINGIPLDDGEIALFLKTYRTDIDALGSTFFETTTALTFDYFAQQQVDTAVVEVGMGGRLDSSNVGNSVLSILTPIDFDHEEYLGYDLPSIAREKCGILKKNTPLVVAPQYKEVMETIHESAAKVNSTACYVSQIAPVSDITVSLDGTRFSMKNIQWYIPLLGEHQVTNAQTATVSCEVFDNTIGQNDIQEGLKKVIWPGRLQKMSDNPLVFYDVAHNPHGLAAALKTVRELFKDYSIGAICALKKSKAVGEIARLLKHYCRYVVTTAPDHGDFISGESLARELSKLGINAVAEPSIAEALDHHVSGNLPYDLWIIFGTHYISEAVFQKFHFPFDKGEI